MAVLSTGNTVERLLVGLALLALGCGDIFGTAIRGPEQQDTEREVEIGRQMEDLDRGLVAVAVDQGVYIGWRLLGTDPEDIAFNLYRDSTLVNDTPITETTDFLDLGGTPAAAYLVRAVVDGVEVEKTRSVPVLRNNYLSIPLDNPGEPLSAHHAAVGDLDGDRALDFVVKRPFGDRDTGEPPRPSEDTYKLEGYRQDGAFLWRIDLSWNIELGINYSPFIVYDLDGDGVAEVIARTGEGTVDGEGVAIGDTDGDGITDYRLREGDLAGAVLAGPEFLSVFDGTTGAEISRTDWIARGEVADWGDGWGNRANQHQLGIAYLDGRTPSIIVIRGIYHRIVVEAWRFKDGALSRLWRYSNEDLGVAYRGGFHNIRIGDIDGDGRDEVVPGAYALDDDGTPMYTTRQDHGDQMHLTDIDPARPGLETWYCQEAPGVYENPVHLRDAETGALIFGATGDWGDVDFALAADIDPDTPGLELWAEGSPLYSAKGEVIGDAPPQCNLAIWWDADLGRELLDGTEIAEPPQEVIFSADGCVSNERRGSPAREPLGYGDIIGDWREEVWYLSEDHRELRVYTTTLPAKHRLYTLLHDAHYRVSMACETMGYMTATQPGFFLGTGMAPPPRPQIVVR